MTLKFDLRTCRICKQEKSLSDFYGRRRLCLICYATQCKVYRETHKGEIQRYIDQTKEERTLQKHNYYQQNQDKIKEYRQHHKAQVRDSHLKRKYGLSLLQWNIKFDSQNRECEICKITKTTYWQTDHNHITGKIRGILCTNCNRALGHLKDNPQILKNAISYIERYNA